MNKVCCFTGHRPNKLYGYDIYSKEYMKLGKIIRDYIEKELIPKGYNTFITGGALGVDTIAFLVIQKLKIKYPNLRSIIAVPFLNQSIKWNTTDIQRYEDMKKMADKVIEVDKEMEKQGIKYSSLIGEYCKQKMMDRNHFMVDKSDFIIGVWDGSSSGTKECLDYAAKKKLKGIYINPKNLEIKELS